jgi:hypothetical protein
MALGGGLLLGSPLTSHRSESSACAAAHHGVVELHPGFGCCVHEVDTLLREASPLPTVAVVGHRKLKGVTNVFSTIIMQQSWLCPTWSNSATKDLLVDNRSK